MVHASSAACLQHSVKVWLQGGIFIGGEPAKQHSVELELLQGNALILRQQLEVLLQELLQGTNRLLKEREMSLM